MLIGDAQDGSNQWRYGARQVWEPTSQTPFFLDVADVRTTAEMRLLFLPFLPQKGGEVKKAQQQRRFNTVQYHVDPQTHQIVHTIVNLSDAMMTQFQYELLGAIEQVVPNHQTFHVWASLRPRRRNFASRVPPGGGRGEQVDWGRLVPQRASVSP